MMNPADLRALFRAAISHPLAEPPFFTALLEATLYAHAPFKHKPGRIRFCQFVHPENGQTMLPLFTEEAMAVHAANKIVRVVAMPARELLELTRGATLMLNPNDEHCVLYPEEIAALLDHGKLPTFVMETVTAPESVGVCEPTVPVTELIAALSALYRRLPAVSEAYLIEVRRGLDLADHSLIVGVVATASEQARVTRATVAAIQPVLSRLTLPILVSELNSGEPIPEMYSPVSPFYVAKRKLG